MWCHGDFQSAASWMLFLLTNSAFTHGSGGGCHGVEGFSNVSRAALLEMGRRTRPGCLSEACGLGTVLCCPPLTPVLPLTHRMPRAGTTASQEEVNPGQLTSELSRRWTKAAKAIQGLQLLFDGWARAMLLSSCASLWRGQLPWDVGCGW